jgi:DNA-binding transcriptional LysR family regulator
VLEHFYLSLQAAAAGLGVAMGPQLLVQDDIAAGRLVAPLGFCPMARNTACWPYRVGGGLGAAASGRLDSGR